MFALRFRCFDITSVLLDPQSQKLSIPILAECVSTPVAVYSTKEFPGLRGSTELTKHLNRYGVKVNIRETPRKRKPKSAVGGPRATHAGEKRKASDEDEDFSEAESDE